MPLLYILTSLLLQQSEWGLLSTVKVEMGFDEFMGARVEKPVFSTRLKERQGTKVVLEGFVIPMQQERSQNYFVLSRFPYQSCFFCGAAGPETVVEVYSDKPFTYTDQRVRVEGNLRLNPDNPLHLFYILDNSKVVSID